MIVSPLPSAPEVETLPLDAGFSAEVNVGVGVVVLVALFAVVLLAFRFLLG